MATLEKIRGKAGCLVVAIGFALAAFLFGDIIKGGSSLKRDKEMNAFTINGKATKVQDYEARVNQVQEMYRGRGAEALNEAQSNQLRNQVFQGMVAEQILQEETSKLGITVSPAETFDLIQGDNISPVIIQSQLFTNQETGMFDKAALLQFLKELNAKANYTPEQQAQIDQYKGIWANLEQEIRQQKLAEKYTTLIANALLPNKLEVAHALKVDATTNDLTYVQQLASTATITVTPTDADLKAYYDKHKEQFKTFDKSAKLDLVYANITPSQDDYDHAKQDIVTAQESLQAGQSPALVLEEYSDAPFMDMYLPMSEYSAGFFPSDFITFLNEAGVGATSDIMESDGTYTVAKLIGKKSTPESLHVRHIVLAPAGTMEGQVNTDSLFNVLQAEPTRFAEVATEYSLDQNSSKRGGELGWLNEAYATRYIDAKFADAIYAATVGVPFRFTSRYGEHIVLVDEAKPAVEKYNVAIAQRKVVASSETQAALYNELSTFLNNNKGAGIAEAALNAGYQAVTDLRVLGSQPMVSNDIENSRSIIRWAMNGKKGETSEINECGDKYVIAYNKGVTEAGYLPLEEMKEQITPVVENQMKVDALFDQLTAANYNSLEAFSAASNLPIDSLMSVKYSTDRLSSIGYEPVVSAAAALAPVNKVLPLKGNNAVYLISVFNRKDDTSALSEESVKANINARRGAVHAQAVAQIINKSDIKDNRSRFQ